MRTLWPWRLQARKCIWLLPLLLLSALPSIAAAAEPAVVSEQFLIRSPQQGPGVDVQHVILLWNIGAEEAESIEVPIPWQAGEVHVEGVPEESLRREGGRLIDLRPLAPGEERLYALSYSVPTPTVPLVLQRESPYPIGGAQFLVESRFRLTGIDLERVEQGIENELLGGTFDRYQVLGIRAGERWQVVIEPVQRRAAVPQLGHDLFHGNPVAFLNDWVRGAPFWIVIGGLVLGGGLVFRARRSRGGEQSASTGGLTDDPRLSPLKEMIVELDLHFRHGEIAEAEYRERRAALKEELLVALSRQAAESVARGVEPEVQSDVEE